MNFKEQLNGVKAFAFDVDGVFTDGMVQAHPSGELIRSYNTRDGYAVQQAISKGFPLAIISGGDGQGLRERFKGIGVVDFYLGVTDKVEALENFKMKYGLNASEILYMGDDIPDFQVMKRVGFPTCPADAAPEIVGISLYISNCAGGRGCVRDVIEQVLKLKREWL